MKTIIRFIPGAILMLCLILAAGCSDDPKTNNPNSPVVVGKIYPTTGGVGTEILITGSNFSENISEIEVTMSGRVLPVVGADMENILVVVPSKMGSGRLDVKVGSHEAVSVEDEFIYIYTATVTTLAGKGEEGEGYRDGEVSEAMFHFNDYTLGLGWLHGSLAVDGQGNVYVGDAANYVIRKISPDGEVTTMAGRAGSSGSVDGTASAARLNAPYGMDMDADGNVIFIDVATSQVRKMTPQGVVTTVGNTAFEAWFVAVNKNTGVYYIGSKGGSALYEWKSTADYTKIADITVNGLAIDNDGNIYASDAVNHKIVKFDAGTWAKTDVAGSGEEGLENGSFATAKFYQPGALAFDSNGDLYVAGDGTWDGGGWGLDQSIRRLDMTAREVVTVAGSGTAGFVNGSGAAAAFKGPQFLTIDQEGVIYVYDKMNNAVRKIVYE